MPGEAGALPRHLPLRRLDLRNCMRAGWICGHNFKRFLGETLAPMTMRLLALKHRGSPRPLRSLHGLGALLVAVWCAFVPATAQSEARSDLAAVEAKIAAQFPSLSHLEPDAYVALAASGQPVIIFDVREEEEFAVSHLAGALRVAPNSDPAAFAASIAAEAKDKTVVFYCSVGMRSSRLASQAAPLLVKAGAASVHNLRGGIFRWSNEGRPLEMGAATASGKASNSGITVHPYNASWGKLIAEPTPAAH